MLSDMIKGWDRAMYYRIIRWALKWLVIAGMLLYILVDLRAKEAAAEARLVRIETAVDSVG